MEKRVMELETQLENIIEFLDGLAVSFDLLRESSQESFYDNYYNLMIDSILKKIETIKACENL